MHDLTNGLCVQLRRFRRRQLDPLTGRYVVADLTHFMFVGSLCPGRDEDEDSLLAEAIRRARRQYPFTGASVQTTLCLSNKRRKIVNEEQNQQIAPVGAIACEYKGEDPRQQDMRLWQGSSCRQRQLTDSMDSRTP